MSGNVNIQTNQTPKTINLPDESEGVENLPESEQKPNEPVQMPDEHIPPVEVPGRPETPEHPPEKSNPSNNGYPVLIKKE